MAFTIDVRLAVIFVVGAVVISAILFVIMRVTMPSYRKVQKRLDEVGELTEENLTGSRVVRAFSRQDEERRDFAEATDRLTKVSESVGELSVIAFGGYTVFDGAITQGELIALVNYLSQILLALIVFANLIVTFTKASASASRINEVFALAPSIEDGSDAAPAPLPNAPKVEFDGVGFSYNADRLSLSDISFSLARGMTLGIIGATGSGKSTLVNLIPRFYDASVGTVKVDGVNVKDYLGHGARQYAHGQ